MQWFLGKNYRLSSNFSVFHVWLFFFFSHRPEDTPWEGGTFKLTLEFTEDYPNKAPVVRFVSKMFHPNGFLFIFLERVIIFSHVFFFFHSVYADGGICLDILQNQWSPIYDIAAILTSIQVCFAFFFCCFFFSIVLCLVTALRSKPKFTSKLRSSSFVSRK